MRFPIVIHKDPSGAYGVTVPDLPGCFSVGGTLDEAIDSAHDAIARHIERLLMDGDPIPARSPLETHRADEDYRDGVWVIVAVDISKLSSRTRRLNITLPARVVAIVDQAAAREGVSRSGLLARAALGYVQGRAGEQTPGLLTDRPVSGPSYKAGSPRRGRMAGGE